jgi:hypothetical protein
MQAFYMELSSMEEALNALASRVVPPSSPKDENKPQQGEDRECPCVDNCRTSLLTLRDTCSFMNATINRCLDYCKSTVGMVLCPVQNSVSLQETMSSVVNCINRTQEGRVSTALCTHTSHM